MCPQPRCGRSCWPAEKEFACGRGFASFAATNVTCRAHSEYMAKEFSGTPPHAVLVQPQDRGTAAGIFFPAHWIYSTDPDAVVAVFPSDHFILEGDAFMRHIGKVATFVRRQPERMVLIGAQADTAETEYGWIEPGDPLGEIGADQILRVTRF